MKKRNHQQKAELRKKLIPIILCSIILSVFAYIIVFNCVTLYQFENNELNNYTGTFGFQRFSGGKRSSSIYVFALDNGDMVSVLCKNVDYQEELSEFSELTFVYSRMTSPGRFPWVYDCLSIVSPDGDVVVDIEDSIDRCRGGLKTTLIILGVCICLSVTANVVYKYIKKKHKL